MVQRRAEGGAVVGEGKCLLPLSPHDGDNFEKSMESAGAADGMEVKIALDHGCGGFLIPCVDFRLKHRLKQYYTILIAEMTV